MAEELQRMSVSVQGAHLDMLVAGHEDNEGVLLLHGFAANAGLFRDVMFQLAQLGYRAYAPNMPGYGKTRLPADADYSLKAVAELYAQWLYQEDFAPIWLVGHDVGGAIAQFLAVDHWDLFSYVTIGDTTIADSFSTPLMKILQGLAQQGMYTRMASAGLIPNPLLNSALRKAFANPRAIADAEIARIFWDSKVTDAEGRSEFLKHLHALRPDNHLAITTRLKHISVPMLLLWAAQDAYHPWDTVGQALKSSLPPHATMVVVEGSGHFLPLENPDAYVKRLLKWRYALEAE